MSGTTRADVAIVTGAARNIGRAIALALAADGAAVVVNARTDRVGAEETAAMIEANGGRAVAYMADITEEGQVQGLVEAALEGFGGLGILINSAALRKQQPFPEMTLADWHEVLAVGLDGAFLGARAAIPHMIAGGGGRIVNLGGKSGHAGAMDRAHVVTAKAGIVGLTKALAAEFGGQGIAVNCVVPGGIDTERGGSAGPPGRYPGGHGNLLGRKGRPAEVAAVIATLCRPDGGYVTGQTIHVNGGMLMT